MELNPYAKYLGDRDPVAVIATTRAGLDGMTTRVTRSQLEDQPAPGKWSVREIVVHLADCEIVFGFRLRQILADDHPTVQPFDQERWAARYASFDFISALRMFEAARNWNLLLIQEVTVAERNRPITHPERGTMTFWTIVETMAGHDINHLQQIQRLVTGR